MKTTHRFVTLAFAALGVGASTPAYAFCFPECSNDFDVGTEQISVMLGGSVLLGGAALGVSAYQLSALSAPPEHGAITAGGVSATLNILLGATYLLLPCDSGDVCAWGQTLGILNLSLGAMNAFTTILLTTVAPKTAVSPVVAFDGDAAHVGLVIGGW